jgi:hypothetical protein
LPSSQRVRKFFGFVRQATQRYGESSKVKTALEQRKETSWEKRREEKRREEKRREELIPT